MVMFYYLSEFVKAIALRHQSSSWCAWELQISCKAVGGLQVSAG